MCHLQEALENRNIIFTERTSIMVASMVGDNIWERTPQGMPGKEHEGILLADGNILSLVSGVAYICVYNYTNWLVYV